MRNRQLPWVDSRRFRRAFCAVYGLALVCVELFLNTFALELSVATLTDAKNGHAVGSYYDPELAFGQLAVQVRRLDHLRICFLPILQLAQQAAELHRGWDGRTH